MTCQIGVLLDKADANQAEVIQMILDDREGYSDEFASRCVDMSIRLYVRVEPQDVYLHREGKCDCQEGR